MNNLAHTGDFMEIKKLDNENLQAQRAVRNMVKRDTIILVCAFFGGLFLMFVLGKNFHLDGILGIPFLLFFLVINNWRQWKALIDHKLRCPHCGQLLAERVNFFWSPSPNCRHCGEIALATIEQLKQDEVDAD